MSGPLGKSLVKKKTQKKASSAVMKSSQKKAVGRPSVFSEKVIGKIIELYGQGKTEEQVANIIGIHKDTLRKYKQRDQDFFFSSREAKALADEMVEASLFTRAIGYNHPEERVFCYQGEIYTHQSEKHYPPDTNAAVFWLKNRRPEVWKDKVHVETEESVPLVISVPAGEAEEI